MPTGRGFPRHAVGGRHPRSTQGRTHVAEPQERACADAVRGERRVIGSKDLLGSPYGALRSRSRKPPLGIRIGLAVGSFFRTPREACRTGAPASAGVCSLRLPTRRYSTAAAAGPRSAVSKPARGRRQQNMPPPSRPSSAPQPRPSPPQTCPCSAAAAPPKSARA